MTDDTYNGHSQGPPRDESTLTASPGIAQIQLTARPGDRFGRYKILEEIGQGGCGAVFVAEQEEPVRRRVALKVIKLGMDTRQVIARFEAERQALAMMDHPNIAKVLDAGATDSGRPFFVMELVRGIKITDYCDQHKLSTPDRLKLFIQVCQAVQHAHQKGIIHRDLKPSNILVTLQDGVPVPKVIDFGIAKATGNQKLTDKTVYTAFEQFIGTPAYMSPEQAEMSGLDVDTRSDIYSLGVLLYELLIGVTPFTAEELLEIGLDAMRRILREKDPARPSTKLSTITQADLTAIALHRQSDPLKLIKLVRGDLDWIVLKCLEKDRSRRYETANGLVRDIQRHLSNEPVAARPQSGLYRFEKVVRRNRAAFAAAAAFAGLLIGATLVSTSLAVRATRAEREQSRLRVEAQANEQKAKTEALKSEQVASFLNSMLQGVGPSVALGQDTKLLREILDQTTARLDEMKAQPEVEADLLSTLGGVYLDMGDYPKAEAMLQQALAIRKNLFGENSLEVASALDLMGQVLHRAGKPSEAEAAYRQALAIREELSGHESLDVASTLNNLGSLLRNENKREEAEEKLREGLALRRKLLSTNDPEIATSLSDLGRVLVVESKTAEAESLVREALAIRRANFPPDHPEIADSLMQLGTILEFQTNYTAAETNFLAALAIQRKVFGVKHRDTQFTIISLAEILRKEGKRSESEGLLREAAEAGNVRAMTDLADMINPGQAVTTNTPEEALKWYRRAAEAGDARSMSKLENMLVSLGGTNLAKAMEWYRKAAEAGDVRSMANLGNMLESLGGTNLAKAMEWYRKAAEAGDAPSMYKIGNTLESLGGTNLAKAMEWYRKAGDARSMYKIGNTLESLGGTNFAEAVEWVRKAAKAGDRDALVRLGYMYEFGEGVPKDGVEAVKWYRQAAERPERDSRWGQWRLGLMYENGNGVPKDATEAAMWFRKASDNGSYQGSEFLGDLYRRGEGVPKDTAQAVRLYRKAADEGDKDVFATLAMMYLQGDGVPTNAMEAEKWVGDLEKESSQSTNLTAESRTSVGLACLQLAQDAFTSGRNDINERMARSAIGVFKQLLQEDPKRSNYPEHLGHSEWQLGNVLRVTGRRDEAESVYQESLQIFEKAAADFPERPFLRQELAYNHGMLAFLMEPAGRTNEAEQHLREAMHLYAALKNSDPTNSTYADRDAVATGQLIAILARQGKQGEAETMIREIISRKTELLSKHDRLIDEALAQRANIFEGEGKLQEAEMTRREELEVEKELSGSEHPYVANSMIHLARLLMQQEKYSEAEPLFLQALAMRRKFPGTQNSDLTGVLASLTMKLLDQREFVEAEPVARECLTLRQSEMPDDWHTFNSRVMLGYALLGQKKFAEAEPLLLSGYEGIDQRRSSIPPEGAARPREALQRLVELYEQTSRPERAAEYKKKLAELDTAGK